MTTTEPDIHADIHTTAGKLADLRRRTEETLHPVGETAVEKVHAKGKLTARERVLALLDEGSFVELDGLDQLAVVHGQPARDWMLVRIGALIRAFTRFHPVLSLKMAARNKRCATEGHKRQFGSVEHLSCRFGQKRVQCPAAIEPHGT